MCSLERLDCTVTAVGLEHDSKCFKKCSGVEVTSFDQERIDKNNDLFQEMDKFNQLLLDYIKHVNKKNNLESTYMPKALTSQSMFLEHFSI